ncbi:hypothetical protein ACUXQ2_005525 [Cupriavidus metallidurans]
MQKTKLALSMISAAALLTLAACGGGGGDSAPATQQPATPTPPAPTITVQGSAPAVTADPVALIYVPQDAVSRGASPHAYVTASVAASAQTKTAEGAYTTVGANSSVNVSLTTGTVADVSGNGNFSIGRWTNGTTSQGNISVNQGGHYVVGKPLALPRTPGPVANLVCSLLSSTNPTAVSGNFPTGKVNTATAQISLGGPGIDSFAIDVAIGSDAHATASTTGAPITGAHLATAGTFQFETLGTDTAKPLLAVGYTIPSPSSGDISGVAILACQ